MKRFKGIAILLVLVLCAGMLAGCGGKDEGIAASVGDQTVPLKDFKNAYDNMLAYNGYYYSYDLSTEEGIEQYQDYIIEQMLAEKAAMYYAQQNGIALTDEEKAEAAAQGAESYDSLYADLLQQAEDAGAAEPKAEANRQLTAFLKQYGFTVKSLKAYYVQSAEDNLLVSKVREAIEATADVSEEALKAAYDEEAALQKELFDEDPTQYFTYEMYAMYGASCEPLYVPEGFFYVRQILVEDEETAEKIKEGLRLVGGSGFDGLRLENDTDAGQPEEGYLIGEGANFVEPFLTAALELEKEGDFTAEPVKSDYGYHFIQRMGNAESGIKPYEEMKETADVFFTGLKQSEAYSDAITAILEDESLTVRNEDLYRSYGK